MDEYEILKKATIEAKEIVGQDMGYLLLNANPIEGFENILDIDTVFVDGKCFGHDDIKEHIVDGEEMMKKFEDIEKKYSTDF